MFVLVTPILKKKSRNVACEKGKPKMYVLVITNLKKKKNGRNVECQKGKPKEG